MDKSWHVRPGIRPIRSRPPIVVVNPPRERGHFGIDSDARREADLVELTLPMPPSANALYANATNGGRFKTKAYDDWLSEAGWEVQRQRPARIAGKYALELVIPRPSHKGRVDLDNRAKPISDLLKKQRIIKDDSDCERLSMSWGPVGSGVRVILTKADAQ
jgi:crossover junction endodeoxyribonuclease RusA